MLASRRIRLRQLLGCTQALACAPSQTLSISQAPWALQSSNQEASCSSELQGTGWGTGVSRRGFAVSGVTQTSPSKLEQVMKLDILTGKSTQEIAQIWLDYHSDSATNKGRAGAVMSADEWALVQERGKKSPMFVLPVAKPGGGYVTLVTQQQLPFTLITSLEEFRMYGPNAPACVTITHYTELVDSAKLVLVRADIVNDKLISVQEARTLLELLRAVYTDGDDYKMVLDFNHQPQAFDFNKLLTKLAIQPAEGSRQ